MKYKDSLGNWVDINIRALDSLPVGTELDYDGTDIPVGWEEVEDVIYADDFKCKNMFDKNSLRQGYLGDNGVIITGTSTDRITPYIDIYPNNSYIVSGLSGSYSRAAAYDENKNFISEVLTNISGSTRTFVTPSNAKYIVLSVANYSDSQLIQLELGTEATPYTPYKAFENEEIYSTNEMVIGTWVDGKPLYRSVVYIDNIASGKVIHPTNLSTNVSIIKFDGYFYYGSGAFKFNHVNLNGTTEECILLYTVNDNGIVIITENKNVSIPDATGIVILEYTKETD